MRVLDRLLLLVFLVGATIATGHIRAETAHAAVSPTQVKPTLEILSTQNGPVMQLTLENLADEPVQVLLRNVPDNGIVDEYIIPARSTYPPVTWVYPIHRTMQFFVDGQEAFALGHSYSAWNFGYDSGIQLEYKEGRWQYNMYVKETFSVNREVLAQHFQRPDLQAEINLGPYGVWEDFGTDPPSGDIVYYQHENGRLTKFTSFYYEFP